MSYPVRRGTSKAVPVVVSAGLAVGVFCGLLFGLGTGKEDAQAAPAKGSATHVDDDAPNPGSGASAAKPAPDKPAVGSGSGSAAVATAGSGSGSASTAGAGSGSGSAAHAAKSAKLIIDITPEAAASVAKIRVDGKDITGNTLELPPDAKRVKVSITAPGYHSEDQVVEIVPDADTKLDIELRKRGATPSPGFGGASTPGNTVPTRPPGPPPKKKPGSDLIDL